MNISTSYKEILVAIIESLDLVNFLLKHHFGIQFDIYISDNNFNQ